MGDFFIIFVFFLETLRFKLISADVPRFSEVWISLAIFVYLFIYFSTPFLPECRSESLLVSLVVMKLLKQWSINP